MSQAKEPLTLTSLVTLLMQARYLNEQQHITGALVYGQGQFMQVMEGEQAVITALYQRIVQDVRHQNVFKLADKAIEARNFAEWSMAFEEVSASQFEELAGYVSAEHLTQHLAASNSADWPLLERMKELIRPTLT